MAQACLEYHHRLPHLKHPHMPAFMPSVVNSQAAPPSIPHPPSSAPPVLTHLLSRQRGFVTECLVPSCRVAAAAPIRSLDYHRRAAAVCAAATARSAARATTAAASEAARAEERLPDPGLLAAPSHLACIELLLPGQ